jgi:hypothetical protein
MAVPCPRAYISSVEGNVTPRRKQIGNLAGPYKFYNDTVTLRFDVDNHVYYRDDGDRRLVRIPGASSIVKIVDKSAALTAWAAKKVAEKMLAIMPRDKDELGEYTRSLPIEDFAKLTLQAKTAPRDILEDAGDVGTMAHKCLEDSIKFAMQTDGRVVKLINLPTDKRAVNCCGAAVMWMVEHNVRWKETERKVYSKLYWYAGTMDGLCLVDSCNDARCCRTQFKDALSVADWKSSNGLWIEYVFQAAGYWGAYVEEFPEQNVTDVFILRLGKERGEFEPWHETYPDIVNDFEAFNTCLDLTRAHEQIGARIKQKKVDKKG